MGNVFSAEELSGSINFTGTISIEDYIFGEVSFIGTAFMGTVYGEIDFVQEIEPQFPYTVGAINFVDPNYFPALSVFDEEDPLPEELCATFGSNVYVICPDIRQGWQIPFSELLECNLDWYGNTPITGNIKLKNSDRKYTNPNDTNFGGIFTEEEIWSNTKNSRKYLFIEQMSKCGDKVNYILFPRLVITTVSGTHTLTINFVDEISYYLFYRKVTLTTYCFEEALTRVDSRHYASYTLTEFYYERNGSNKQSEFYINSEIKSPYSLDTTENIITLASNDEVTNENIPVVLRNPKLVKEIIVHLMNQVIDTQEGNIIKEHLNVEMYFKDFFIYNTIEIQDTDIISILKKNFFDAIPADFYVRPILNYEPYGLYAGATEALYLASANFKPTLIIQDVVLEDEFTVPNYRIPESMVRGECEPKLTGLRKFNSQKVMKPGIIGKSYVLEVSDVVIETEEVPVIPPPIVVNPPQYNYYKFHPLIPLIVDRTDRGIDYCRYGTINDVISFKTDDALALYFSLTVGVGHDSLTYTWEQMFDPFYYPDGYQGVRSGTFISHLGLLIATILWDEPYYEKLNEYQRII